MEEDTGDLVIAHLFHQDKIQQYAILQVEKFNRVGVTEVFPFDGFWKIENICPDVTSHSGEESHQPGTDISRGRVHQ